MKHVKRILAMCMAVITMCSTAVGATYEFSVGIDSNTFPGNLGFYGSRETGYFGVEKAPLEYPVTYKFIDAHIDDLVAGFGHEVYWEWYHDLGDRYSDVKYFAYLWYKYFDPEAVWPSEYLDAFGECLEEKTNYKYVIADDGSQIPQYRIDSYSWNEKTLTVQCSADYSIKYIVESTEGEFEFPGYYNAHIKGGFSVVPRLFITDKNDGSFVYPVYGKGAWLKPYYEYYNEDREISADVFRDEYGGHPLDADGVSYTGTTTESYEFTMPDFFDPEKHDVTLYFRNDNSGYYSKAWFYNPYELMTEGSWEAPEIKPEPLPVYEVGDVNKDLSVNLADASLMLKYIAEWDGVVIDTSLADADGNGRVGLVDVSMVLKKIDGWNK